MKEKPELSNSTDGASPPPPVERDPVTDSNDTISDLPTVPADQIAEVSLCNILF